MIKKTNDYSIFTFREDNREKIDQGHVKRLIESINSRNLLELRPILVNGKMEVIDGQHRLLAAKSLGVDIYYQMEKGLSSHDVILMNNSKSWGTADYLNFYCQHEYPEYLKLKEFMKKHNLTLKVALNITYGRSHKGYTSFKKGEFVFDDKEFDKELEYCWQTIDYIKRMNGYSLYTSSSRFWKALVMLVRDHNFQYSRWYDNLSKMVERFTAKATTKDYLLLMQEIYNRRSPLKVNLLEGD